MQPLAERKNDKDSSDEEEDKKSSSDGESSQEDADPNEPFSVNEPVNRLDAKTQAQRNKDRVHKLALERLQKEKPKRQLAKDVAKLPKIIKTIEAKARGMNKKRSKSIAVVEAEKKAQEKIGVVAKAKKIGRFVYK